MRVAVCQRVRNLREDQARDIWRNAFAIGFPASPLEQVHTCSFSDEIQLHQSQAATAQGEEVLQEVLQRDDAACARTRAESRGYIKCNNLR